VNGEAGAKKVLQIFKEEFDLTLALSGKYLIIFIVYDKTMIMHAY